jgi:glutathione synthase/RimK-type ligase-like ATP-grasp enzyme
MKIAIGHDIVEKHTDGNSQSFSALWKSYADETGIEAEVVRPLLPGAIDEIRRFDAMIWRYNFQTTWLDAGPRIMRAVEDDLGLPVWPPRVLRDTFENKTAQAYLLEAHGIAHPRTWVFWHEAEARARLDDLPFPLVAKLSRGVQSQGVALVRNRAEAEVVIERMFSFGVSSMDFMRNRRERRFGKYAPVLQAMRRGRFKGNLERGYVLFQEFIPGNDFDTRLIVQGDKVLAYRRHNREGDFRASGSGRFDYDPDGISPAAIELAFDLAAAMGVRSMVADVIFDGETPLINEFSYSMAMHIVRPCPCYWTRTSEGTTRVDAPLDWPRATFEAFIADVTAAGEHRGGARRSRLPSRTP